MGIRILPPDVASRIAAGEVVERPASVAKELLENALDAGATRVHTEVQGGGIRSIQVTDNGCGIPPEEVELAVKRHGTSKITSADDLWAISTLGFRGEALPSIASIAELSILTRIAENPAGTYLHIKDANQLRKASRSSSVGTTVKVQHLFRSLPARLKFLKTPSTEGERIANLLSNYAIAYPAVKFTLVMDGRRVLDSAGNNSIIDSLGAIYGEEIAGKLLELNGKGEGDSADQPMEVQGHISPPSLTRANRQYINLFVNGRWIQNRPLTYALEQAYQGFLTKGRHPLALLRLTVPPQELDINVHPTKSEVRFLNERAVFSLIQKSVRDVLLQQSPIPQVVGGTGTTAPTTISGIQQPWPLTTQPSKGKTKGPSVAPHVPKSVLPILRVIGQLNHTFIVAEGPDGLYLIDQHAAHERVIFDTLRGFPVEPVELQGLLEPIVIELTPAQDSLLQNEASMIHDLGFSPEPFGECSYLLRAIPASLSRNGPSRVLQELLDATMAEEVGYDQSDKLAISFACHSSVRAGDQLAHREMEDLARQLETSSQPNTCPHGRPTIVHLDSAYLEKEFGRR